ncbi:hypothetical protein [Aureispira anguillae]|nr:hypothetical protein [Aureispira anguillae]
MYRSKLIDLLQILDRQEKEAFKKWINSPIHNQHQKSKELLLLLLSKRSLTPRTTHRKKVYAQLYPNEIYQDAKLKHIMSYCVQLLENFIEFLMQKKSTFSNKKMLIEFLEKRKLNKYAKQNILKLQQAQQNQLVQDSNYHYHQFQLEKIIFEHQNTASRTRKTNLQPLLDHHYLAFVLETLNYACETIMHQRLYKSVYEVPLLTAVLGEIESGRFDTIPAVQLYFYSYMSLQHPNKENYFQVLQRLLIKHHDALSPKELKSIYLIAINYCVRQLNNGVEKYVRSVFELYQYGLEHAILIENNQLSQFTHKNIITAAIRLKEYDWARQFITDYTPLLEPTYQENYAYYANAKLLFAQHQYDACMQLLVQVEFDDLFLNMSAKVMLLKIYYERQYIDALMALLMSFKRFLQRKSIVAYHREIYKNMIYLTEKMLAIPPNDATKREELRQEIEQTNPLTEKPWLLAQLKQL